MAVKYDAAMYRKLFGINSYSEGVKAYNSYVSSIGAADAQAQELESQYPSYVGILNSAYRRRQEIQNASIKFLHETVGLSPFLLSSQSDKIRTAVESVYSHIPNLGFNAVAKDIVEPALREQAEKEGRQKFDQNVSDKVSQVIGTHINDRDKIIEGRLNDYEQTLGGVLRGIDGMNQRLLKNREMSSQFSDNKPSPALDLPSQELEYDLFPDPNKFDIWY